MRVVVQNTLTNRQWVAFDSPAGFTVGRDDTCSVKLDSRFISGTHLKVERSEIGWEVELLPGVSPVEVNGTEVKPAQKVQFDIAVAASQRALMAVAISGLQAKERVAAELAKPLPDLNVLYQAHSEIVEMSAPLFRDAGNEWERLYGMLDRAQVAAAKRFLEDQLGPFLSGWK